MLQIRDLHHVTLLVRDLARAREFYEGVLSLQPIPRPPFPFPGAWYALGDGQLHLIVDTEKALPEERQISSRKAHTAIRVASFSKALGWLKARGFSPEAQDPGRKILLIPDSVAGFPQIFLQDPDGNILELNAESLEEPETTKD